MLPSHSAHSSIPPPTYKCSQWASGGPLVYGASHSLLAEVTSPQSIAFCNSPKTPRATGILVRVVLRGNRIGAYVYSLQQLQETK